MGKIAQLPFINSRMSIELYEKRVEWLGFVGPLWGHHPKWDVQIVLFKDSCDGGTDIFFIQLLSADIHNFGLSPHKSNQRTLMIKIYNLNKIIQPITV